MTAEAKVTPPLLGRTYIDAVYRAALPLLGVDVPTMRAAIEAKRTTLRSLGWTVDESTFAGDDRFADAVERFQRDVRGEA